MRTQPGDLGSLYLRGKTDVSLGHPLSQEASGSWESRGRLSGFYFVLLNDNPTVPTQGVLVSKQKERTVDAHDMGGFGCGC